MRSRNARATVLADLLGMGTSSQYLQKASMKTSMYLFPEEDAGNPDRMSTLTRRKG